MSRDIIVLCLGAFEVLGGAAVLGYEIFRSPTATPLFRFSSRVRQFGKVDIQTSSIGIGLIIIGSLLLLVVALRPN